MNDGLGSVVMNVGGGGASNPGTGARYQLAAVGYQDVFLRGPWSPWVYAFKRATRFAAWTDDIQMDVEPGKRTQCVIPKSGDLLADMYLQITLPAVGGMATWPALVGYALLRRVRLLLNDAEIHNFERLWFDMYDQLHTSAGHAAGLDVMVGRTPLSAAKTQTLLVPLRMLTGRKGASRPPLPLQAIPRADLRLDIEWAGLAELGLAVDPGIKVKVLCDYVEVDADEKTRLLKPGTLAFESVIDSDAVSYAIDTDGDLHDLPALRVNLSNVRYAVKMLVWVCYVEPATTLFQYLPYAIDKINVTFNSQDRFFNRPAAYFDTIQKYQHCARSPPGVPGVYSFALDATSRYNTGTADFGALAAAALQATVVAPGAQRFKLKVFSVYYNFLEIGGASARLVFV
jgi:hypothetical protein